MNHLGEWKKDDTGNRYLVCSCGWCQEGESQSICDAFTKHVEANTPAWRDRPTVPGWWLCGPPKIGDANVKYAMAIFLSQEDFDKGCPHNTKRVYGPIPDDPEEKTP